MYLGFDIGGTFTKYGITDDTYKIHFKDSFPTPTESQETLLGKISDITNDLKNKYDITSVGIGVPGLIDPSLGIIKVSANLPFKNTPAKNIVSQATGLPVFVGNDANCAALGEFSVFGKNADNSVMITIGTGIGGGMIIGKKLYTAKNGLAGEIGHMTIVKDGKPCPCGKCGCYEKYASAKALVEMARNAVTRYPESRLSKDFLNSPEKLDGKAIFSYARSGSEIANALLTEYVGYLVTGLENIVDILQPDEVVLAGGITNDDDILMSLIDKQFSGRCVVRVSGLKNDAGFIGAALLAKQ